MTAGKLESKHDHGGNQVRIHLHYNDLTDFFIYQVSKLVHCSILLVKRLSRDSHGIRLLRELKSLIYCLVKYCRSL